MSEIQFWEALAALMAAIQMGCIAILVTCFPIAFIEAAEKFFGW